MLTNKLGKQFSDTLGVYYAMNMEFTVKPPNVGNEPGIRFDVARKLEKRVWNWKAGIPVLESNVSLPPGDSPNDEAAFGDPSADKDNDNTPQNDRIYSIDGPGIPSRISSNAEFVGQWNLYEFVRVNVERSKPTGNNDDLSSRSSDFVPWHVQMALINNGSAIFIPNPAKANSVGLGAIPLASGP